MELIFKCPFQSVIYSMISFLNKTIIIMSVINNETEGIYFIFELNNQSKHKKEYFGGLKLKNGNNK